MILAFVGMLAGIVFAGEAAAVPDHLSCARIRPDHAITGIVDLSESHPGFPAMAGCRIRGPKALCTGVAKTVVTAVPDPPGAPAGPAAGTFLCYKARCPGALPDVSVSDQFGSFTVRHKRSLLLCTPAQIGAAPSTTTTTRTTTTLGNGTTTTIQSCGVGDPLCGGTCPAGQTCVPLSFGGAGTGCGCATVPVCEADIAGACGGNCPPACLCITVGPSQCGCSCL